MTSWEINERQTKIERAHRFGSKTTPKPIIVKFSFFKDRDEVLKTYRQKTERDKGKSECTGR